MKIEHLEKAHCKKFYKKKNKKFKKWQNLYIYL